MNFFILSLYLILSAKVLRVSVDLLEIVPYVVFNFSLWSNLLLFLTLTIEVWVMGFFVKNIFKVLNDIVEDVGNTKVDNDNLQ